MSELNSPPGANVSNAFVRLIVKPLLTLAIGVGWLMTGIGAPVFDAGERLETWARGALRRAREP